MRRLILLTVLVAACSPTPRPSPDKCSEACSKLRQLGCPEGFPLEDGTTCEQFCYDTQTRGHDLDPECVSQIESCGALEECGQR